MKDGGKSRNRNVNLVQVVINMRDSDRIHIVEFQRVHQKWR